MSQRLAGILFATALALGAVTSATAAPVNVNKASAEEISAALKGIGLKKAREIVTFRETHGPFRSVDQLGDVKGVGRKTVEQNRDDIRLQ